MSGNSNVSMVLNFLDRDGSSVGISSLIDEGDCELQYDKTVKKRMYSEY